MTDHKFTDEEVIKALEHYKGFRLYPFDKCEEGDNNILVDDALDLINRQKAEIERLRKYYFTHAYDECHNEAIKEFAEKLKKRLYDKPSIFTQQRYIVNDEINHTVKEMTEGKTDENISD